VTRQLGGVTRQLVCVGQVIARFYARHWWLCIFKEVCAAGQAAGVTVLFSSSAVCCV
jgi:hypothetical protein